MKLLIRFLLARALIRSTRIDDEFYIDIDDIYYWVINGKLKERVNDDDG